MSKRKPVVDVELDDDDFEPEDAEETSDDGETNDERIQRIVAANMADTHKFMAEQFEKVHSKLADHDLRIENVEKKLENLIKLDQKQAVIEAAESRPGLDKFLDVTFGTAGRALHAVVDTVAFVGESVVDIVTLGRAKVQRQK